MNFVRINKNDTEKLNLIVSMDEIMFDNPWNIKQWVDEVENETNTVEILYYDREYLHPFGFISYSTIGDTIELKKIGILPYFRRQRWGFAVLQILLDKARLRKIHNVILEVAVTNTAAIRLYEKSGFYKISIRKKYYNNLVDAIVMQKEV